MYTSSTSSPPTVTLRWTCPSMPRPIDGRGNIHATLEWAPAFIAMDDEVVAILWAP